NASRLAGDCPAAIASYSRSIELYTALQLPTHIYQAHKGRLLCYLAQQDDASARREIGTAVALVETYRTKIFGSNSRDNFFDQEQQVYDIAIEFEFRSKNIEQAFQYSENSRARSLLDLVNSDIHRN